MENRISAVVRNVPFSLIREMSLRAAGFKRVISLGIGEPDFDTPEAVSRQALEDALHGATHYTPSQGDPELIEAIRAYIKDRFGRELSSRRIVVTGGGMGALTAYFRTVLEPGDEVLVPEPFFPAYRSQIEWAGGKVVHVPTRFEDGFLPTPEALAKVAGPRAKVLLLNSPNNPTGAVIPAGALDAMAEAARERDLLVVSDEVYERLLFTGKPMESACTREILQDRLVVIHSFSKSFAMTGWRIGYAFGAEWIIGAMTKVVSSCTSCAPSVSQRAALAALRLDSSVFDEMREKFRVRRDTIYEGLKKLPGVRVLKPEGAFYIFPDIGRITGDTRRFALDLLEKEQVVVVPGEAFGPSGKGCVRIAYTVGPELLSEALDRIARFIRENY